MGIQIGILGEGRNPNYQVNFVDGTVKTFHYSGKPHKIESFKSSNLSQEYFWNELNK